MEDHGWRNKERLETIKYRSVAGWWGLTCQVGGGRRKIRVEINGVKEEEKVDVRWCSMETR